MAKNNEEKRCRKCKKIIVGDAKFGLCPRCRDDLGKGGTIVVFAAGIVGTVAKIILSKGKK